MILAAGGGQAQQPYGRRGVAARGEVAAGVESDGDDDDDGGPPSWMFPLTPSLRPRQRRERMTTRSADPSSLSLSPGPIGGGTSGRTCPAAPLSSSRKLFFKRLKAALQSQVLVCSHRH